MSRYSYELSGAVERGKLELSEKAKKLLRAVLQGWPDCQVRILIEKRSARHSDAQRRYYHACIVRPLAGYLGHEHGEMHEVLKAMHLDKQQAADGVNGTLMNKLVIGGSTKKLNKNDFHDYIERVRDWAAMELNFTTADPDPEYWKAKDAA